MMELTYKVLLSTLTVGFLHGIIPLVVLYNSCIAQFLEFGISSGDTAKLYHVFC